ncbi:MAG: hypothetical protein WDN03_01185 [Rhizomicrobium sp.]
MRRAIAALLLGLLPAPLCAAPCVMPTPGAIAAAAGPPGGVAAAFGDSVITTYDLQQGLALRLALEGVDGKPLARKAGDELKTMELEEGWLADARARNISVAPAEVDAAIAAMLDAGHVSPAMLQAMLTRTGATMASLRGRIAVAIAHAKARGVALSLPYRIAQRACR